MSIEGVTFPVSTIKFDEKAAQTPFSEVSDNFSRLLIVFSKPISPLQLNFVIKRDNQWFNNNNNDYSIVLKKPLESSLVFHAEDQIKEFLHNVIESETVYDAWTLMHRFNLCNS